MPVTLVLAALFLPPLAVFLDEGGLTRNFWIALGLTCLGYIPGVIFALLLLVGRRRALVRG